MGERTYITGSSRNGIRKPNDVDKIQFIDSSELIYQHGYDTDGACLFKISRGTLEKALTDPDNTKYLHYFLYQFDKHFIGDEFPMQINILDYRDTLKRIVSTTFHDEIAKQISINKRKKKQDGSYSIICKKLKKHHYHIIYTIFILKNNSTVLDETQMDIINRVHDWKMGYEYFDVLMDMINEIRNKEISKNGNTKD